MLQNPFDLSSSKPKEQKCTNEIPACCAAVHLSHTHTHTHTPGSNPLKSSLPTDPFILNHLNHTLPHFGCGAELSFPFRGIWSALRLPEKKNK